MNYFATIISLIIVCLSGCDLFGPKNKSSDKSTELLGEGDGIASQYPRDRNIQEHPSVIFASGFENNFQGWTYVDEEATIIREDDSLSQSGNKFLQITATKGENVGGKLIYEFPENKEKDEAFFRFYVKFDEDTIMPHHMNKIRALKPDPYYPNAGQRPEGNEAFWTGIEPSSQGKWHFYTYWHKMRSWQTPGGESDPERGSNPYYGNVFEPPGQEPIKRDEWICVEAYIKANTPGKSDGAMAFWIDGEKRGEWRPGHPEGTWLRGTFYTSGPYNTDPKPFEGFNFRADSTVKINSVLLEWYLSHEHAQDSPSDQNIVYFDDIVVATEYIGPQASPTTEE